MTRPKPGKVRSYWPVGGASIVLALLAWAGLLYMTYLQPPTGIYLPAAFLLLFSAVSATAIPFSLLINSRVRKVDVRPSLWRPVRQGLWVGLWVTLCAWLQLLRLLEWFTALLFLILFVMVELFFLSRK